MHWPWRGLSYDQHSAGRLFLSVLLHSLLVQYRAEAFWLSSKNKTETQALERVEGEKQRQKSLGQVVKEKVNR